ncbi:hypothetical protein [Flavobacterium ajazii]|uniref:hypothetical protein n=1 Tax=Flavobacterium ajazii TaxID=2692318 RepID=UPI0013D0BE92|nr:hypothetical protein [Flavobacterium ajazii]
MSKLGCVCGNTIVDQCDNLDNKAYFIRDQDYEKSENYTEDIESFINAVKNDSRDKWTEKYFGSEVYKNLSNSTVIQDIISRYKLKYESTMYQCKNCGRVKIEKGTTNIFTSFETENDQSMDIFKVVTENES